MPSPAWSRNGRALTCRKDDSGSFSASAWSGRELDLWSINGVVISLLMRMLARPTRTSSSRSFLFDARAAMMFKHIKHGSRRSMVRGKRGVIYKGNNISKTYLTKIEPRPTADQNRDWELGIGTEAIDGVIQ